MTYFLTEIEKEAYEHFLKVRNRMNLHLDELFEEERKAAFIAGYEAGRRHLQKEAESIVKITLYDKKDSNEA